MAFRWFLRSVSTQVVVEHGGKGDGGFPTTNNLMESMKKVRVKGERCGSGSRILNGGDKGGRRSDCSTGFQMPLHYPRYKKEEYERMEEWKVDMLLKEYGLASVGSLQEKRTFAMGAFLWPDQL